MLIRLFFGGKETVGKDGLNKATFPGRPWREMSIQSLPTVAELDEKLYEVIIP